MRFAISRAIAGAAAIATRSLGPVQAFLVVRPPSPTAADTARAKAPPRETTLLKIEINLNR